MSISAIDPPSGPTFHLLDAVRYRGRIGQVVGMAIVEDRVVYDVRTAAGLHRVAGGTGALALAEPLEAASQLARPVRR